MHKYIASIIIISLLIWVGIIQTTNNIQQEEITETHIENTIPPQQINTNLIVTTPKTIKAKVTAYTYTGNLTSRGGNPHRGICAVDEKEIPYGTTLYIPGYGIASSEDTGGAIRAYEGIAIDVFMNSKQEADEWGVKYLDVEVR